MKFIEMLYEKSEQDFFKALRVITDRIDNAKTTRDVDEIRNDVDELCKEYEETFSGHYGKQILRDKKRSALDQLTVHCKMNGIR